MTPEIPAAVRNRLIKLLGLLGSDQAGERDAAALAAMRLLGQHKLTWDELLARPSVHREPLHGTWRDTCADLMEMHTELRPWERKFVADLSKFPHLSTKQRYVLSEIADRVLGPRDG